MGLLHTHTVVSLCMLAHHEKAAELALCCPAFTSCIMAVGTQDADERHIFRVQGICQIVMLHLMFAVHHSCSILAYMLMS